jgi:glucose 1-dehydrogenase
MSVKKLFDLSGKVALVTGGSRGLGLQMAEALGEMGAKVAITARKQAELDEAEARLKAQRIEVVTVASDLSKFDSIPGMVERVLATFGTIDILVNNAGIQQDAPFEELTLQQWNRVISVNLTGQFLCSREAVREFKRRGVRQEVSCAAGKIICISSVHEVIPWAGHVNYAASKGGVMLMMKSIAQEVAPYRIRVNSICPGAIRTPINMQAWGTPEAYHELLKLIPYKRIGEPEEIGRTAVWLASDYADYVHGVSLFVDGGMTLYPGFETGG